MRKLDAVEEARALMSEGREWGVWKWLTEKSRVRRAADRATEALDKAAEQAKEAWRDDLRIAYNEAVAAADVQDGKRGAKRKLEKIAVEANGIDPKLRTAMRHVLEADDEGQRAADDAEEMFAEAERRMSTDMARDAAQKALESYDLRERAIKKAEAAGRSL